jgi:hypothetical protein
MRGVSRRGSVFELEQERLLERHTKELTRKLAEEQRKREISDRRCEQEQRKREEEPHKREEEQRMRKEAEHEVTRLRKILEERDAKG